MSETLESVAIEVDQQQLAEQLLAQAKEQGIELVGPNGLLSQLTKRVLETALEAEMSEHLGYDKHDPAGRNHGNSRNGVRSKTAGLRARRIFPARGSSKVTTLALAVTCSQVSTSSRFKTRAWGTSSASR